MAKEVQVYFLDREDNHYFIKEDEIPLLKPQTEATIQEFLKELCQVELQNKSPFWIDLMTFLTFLLGFGLTFYGLYIVSIKLIVVGCCLIIMFVVYLQVYECLDKKKETRKKKITEAYQEKLNGIYDIHMELLMEVSIEPVSAFTLVPSETVIHLNLDKELRPQLIDIVTNAHLFGKVKPQIPSNQPMSSDFKTHLFVYEYDQENYQIPQSQTQFAANNQGPVVRMS